MFLEQTGSSQLPQSLLSLSVPHVLFFHKSCSSGVFRLFQATDERKWNWGAENMRG